ncbi:hypothetical protein [Tunturiibacter gelidiferens]|uniref:hypothetical protein n=1 Tax=Tunturiibacter gelidiferens TaxID=3069689 RepID=UPI003D9BA3A1
MRKTDRLFGAFGLILEGTTILIFLVYFVAARVGVAGATLPLSRTFLHYIVMPVFLAPLVGVGGLFFDRRRLLSVAAIMLALPTLTLMGVLNGNF